MTKDYNQLILKIQAVGLNFHILSPTSAVLKLLQYLSKDNPPRSVTSGGMKPLPKACVVSFNIESIWL